MIKTLTNLFKQDKEKFVVPKGVQDVIPIKAIYDDGIFLVGKDKFAKSFKFSDINYAVASREDKEAMFLEYSELLNSFDSGATTKITINNRRLNRLDFERNYKMDYAGDFLDVYREEKNGIMLENATGANAIVQDKYVTISVNKKSIEEARNYFARVGADLIAHFGRLGSKCYEMETDDRLRIIHDFFRVGEESSFRFDINETRKKGHDFKDYTKEQLDQDTEALMTTCRKHLCQFGVLKFQQMDGLNTVMPYGTRKIDTFRTLTTESLAVFIPFRVQDIFHEHGIYYGTNVISKNMIIADRRQLLNGNSFILGVSGSGKSFTAKGEITDIMLADPTADVIIIDPEREYSPLVNALGGEIINISATSPNHINAMDMNKDYGDGANPVILK